MTDVNHTAQTACNNNIHTEKGRHKTAKPTRRELAHLQVRQPIRPVSRALRLHHNHVPIRYSVRRETALDPCRCGRAPCDDVLRALRVSPAHPLMMFPELLQAIPEFPDGVVPGPQQSNRETPSTQKLKHKPTQKTHITRSIPIRGGQRRKYWAFF